MRRVIVCGLLTSLAVSVVALSIRAADPSPKKTAPGKLRHVVLVKFQDDTTEQQVKAIEAGFRALPSKIPTITDFEWGTNNSPEGLAQGFTHCFLVTFNDAKGRGVYLPHKAHQDFVKVLKPHLDKVLVIDYLAKD